MSMSSVGLGGAWSTPDSLIPKGPHPAQHFHVHSRTATAHPPSSRDLSACTMNAFRAAPCQPAALLSGLRLVCLCQMNLSCIKSCLQKGTLTSYKCFYQEAHLNCRALSMLYDLCQHHEMKEEG